MKSINEMFCDIICLNEGGEAVALQFSDPDGVKSGKSGWSFGVCQFDTRNNQQALACLKECGFTEDEIHGIVDQTINVKPLAAKLKAHADVIERYDMAQLQHCLDAAANFMSNYGIPDADGSGILALADYVNQYGSLGMGAASFFRMLGRPVDAAAVLGFKLNNTKYGKEHPKDCKRRFDNIMAVFNKEQTC